MATMGDACTSRGADRFLVQSSDVLEDMKVNVYEEGTSNLIWYKERYLGTDEIVESLVHNATKTVCWTIHHPVHGWYLRIRSPTFPPGVFIPLVPVPQSAPYHVDAAMTFNSRTNIPPPTTTTATPEAPARTPTSTSTPTSHSYPPTPTASASSLSLPPPARPPSSQITQFVLAPSYHTPPSQDDAASTSLFTRALSVLKTHNPIPSNSFTLARVVPPNPHAPPPPYHRHAPPAVPHAHRRAPVPVTSPSTVALNPNPTSSVLLEPTLHAPLLQFHDRTPVFTVRSLTGVIEIDREEEERVGIETSFWVAVALTYLEFLEERESYLAAITD